MAGRFLTRRLDGLHDEPRPGVPRTITDAQVEEAVGHPGRDPGRCHALVQAGAGPAGGISPTSVHRIWRSLGLQPWRTEEFKISPGPLLTGKIRGPARSTCSRARAGTWATANNAEIAYTLANSSWLNRIEAQFTALRYFALDGTGHATHQEQASMIRRYIIWRNNHACDERPRRIIDRANVA
jgi:hypothetical protein